MPITHTVKASKFKLWHKIFLALILGSLTGLILGDSANIFAPIGKMFINAISMVVIPIIFVSIVCSVMAISDVSTMGRLTAKALALYLGTMAIATGIGVGLALIIKPGMGLPKELVEASLQGNQVLGDLITQGKSTSLIDTITSIIPSNPFMAFANGEILPTILFALIIGLAIVSVGKPAKPVGDFFQSGMMIMFKAVEFILFFAPLGVFALIAQVVGTVGVEVLKELSLLVITIYIGCILNVIIVYVPLLMYNRLNPLTFFKKMIAPMAFAFSTGSSAATLPLNLQTVHHRLGVSTGITDFILPLGATINMNGLSVYLGVAAMFVANIFGVDLSLWQYILIIMTSTLASIGAAGVPMAGIIVMSIVLGGVGLPIEAIALIAGVDRIIEMMTTSINITGDAVTAVIVAKSEDQLNEAIYNDNTELTD
jgi:Na+/H+-dicarboxylate symporter